MSQPVNIQRAEAGQAESFRRALDAVARERRYLLFTEAPPLESVRTFMARIAATNSSQFFAVHGDEVVGWCDVIRDEAAGRTHSGSLGMGILPGFRSQGLGARLLAATVADAFDKGLARIQLEVFSTNTRAIELYRRAGFAVEGRKRQARLLDGVADDFIVMALLKTPAGDEAGNRFIDLTLCVTPAMRDRALAGERMAALGHLGTHFDVMDQPFPLRNLERPGVVFDVAAAAGRDIDVGDLDLAQIAPGQFVAFRTGFIEQAGYASESYFTAHPQLAPRLIDALIDRRVAILGLDFAGLRRGAEHTPMDRHCADRGVFVVENLCNLHALLAGRASAGFTAHTFPVNFTGMTGLPCRVVGEI